MGDVLQNPRYDHERCLGEHVIPNLHGIHLYAGLPPVTDTNAARTSDAPTRCARRPRGRAHGIGGEPRRLRQPGAADDGRVA